MNSPDFAPLTSEVTRTDVAEFVVDSRAAGQEWARAAPRGGGTGALVVILVILVALGLSTVRSLFPFLAATVAGTPTEAPPTLLMFGLGIALVTTLAALQRNRGAHTGMHTWSRWLRLDRFARANDMFFSPSESRIYYPGSVFQVGDVREIQEHFYRNDGRFLDMGNYRWEAGSNDSRSSHTWGFMALQLDRTLPHMVLDSRSNNGLLGVSNLPVDFSRDQRLSLEGDFNRHFSLYCPKEYEADALYIFTPDLMALLIDHANTFDVEIIDYWMLLYSTKKLDLADIPTLKHLFSIVDSVGAKTVSQTHRYADDRVGDRSLDQVAPQGKRLRIHLPLWVKIAAVAFVVVWIYAMVAPVIQTALSVFQWGTR